jgi:hypothetical protein
MQVPEFVCVPNLPAAGDHSSCPLITAISPIATLSALLSHNLAQLHIRGQERAQGAENVCPNLREEAFGINDLPDAESFAT